MLLPSTVEAYFFGGPDHGTVRQVNATVTAGPRGPVVVPPVLYEFDWISVDPDDETAEDVERCHVRYLRSENRRVTGSERWVYRYDGPHRDGFEYDVPDDASALAD